jgi:hypothetical protein
VPEKVMTPVPLPEITEANCTSDYDHRVLFLSGIWERPGNEFRLRATIMVGKDGSADGSIYWQAVRVHGQAAHYFATEWVHGFIRGRDVEWTVTKWNRDYRRICTGSRYPEMVKLAPTVG